MNTTLEKLNSIPAIIDNVISEVKNGNIPALPSYIKSKRLSKQLDRLDKEIKENALEEASRYSEKTGEIDGIKWEYKNGSGRYLYEQDSEYSSLKKQRDKIDELMKQRADLLKTATKYSEQGRELVVDGEVIIPVGYIAYSDSISVK